MHCLLFLLLPFVLEFCFVCSDIPLSLLSCVWVQVLQEDTGLISSPLLKQGQVEPLHVMCMCYHDDMIIASGSGKGQDMGQG